MRFTAIVIAGVLVGCVETSAVDCGEGSFCPPGKVCVRATEELTVCATPDNGECLALEDGELCATAGRCYDHVCVPIACGDHIVDPTEACDGGNAVGGDGCSADCRSDEQCGTGVLDPAKGEACDDGNQFAHDGCSIDCELEMPHWTQVQPGLPLRDGPSLAFDPVRGTVVMFGTGPETLEWNGFGWTQRQTQFSPFSRSGQAMAYDSARKNVVMFGGNVFFDAGDTWLLDHTGWKLASSQSVVLSRRSFHAMAYDPVRERVVLFGGKGDVGNIGSTRLDDTYEWDGSTWTRMVTPVPPAARERHALAYDPARGTVVLFGGVGLNDKLRDDMWEWNGIEWKELAVTPRPSPRQDVAMATYRGGLLLHGGATSTGADGETWRWADSQWQLLDVSGPGPRASAALVTDVLRDRVVLFGGLDQNGVTSEDVWEWDGSAWARASVTRPPPMEYGAVAFDSRRGRPIVVGESTTFELVGQSSWAPVTASTPLRRNHGVAYDHARDELVMFGGLLASNNETADTWVLVATGSTRSWIQRTPATSPAARSAFGLTYDGARSRSVLFGGSSAGVPRGDTWEWNGVTWQDVSPATGGPPPRSAHSLAYDPIRRVTVLFGGSNDKGEALGDTWEWNGTAWTAFSPAPGSDVPLARNNATLAWNAARRRITLMGGVSGFLLGRLDDSWEWDGTSWTQVATEIRPPGTSGHVAVQSPDGTDFIVFGGATYYVSNNIWRLRWEGTRIDEQCGGRIDHDGDGLAGCADPDCWARCTPLCGPGVSCASTASRCGDGMAAPRESCQLCPQDVTACPSCGDLLCEATETIATCPGDCAP